MQSFRAERSCDGLCSMLATVRAGAGRFEPWAWSGTGVESSDDDADESPHGCLRAQGARGGQCVQAVGGELVGRHVAAKLARLGAFGDQLGHETMQALMRARD